jgi:hypothetical protein
LFCVVFAIMPHKQRAAPNGGFARCRSEAIATLRDQLPKCV